MQRSRTYQSLLNRLVPPEDNNENTNDLFSLAPERKPSPEITADTAVTTGGTGVTTPPTTVSGTGVAATPLVITTHVTTETDCETEEYKSPSPRKSS